jgi:hypothetical protein
MNQGLRRKDHIATEEKYTPLRELAYSATMDEFPDIQIQGISFYDAVEADRWKTLPIDNAHRNTRSTWGWAEEYPFYQKRPNRFEITLRRGGVLCALSYGQLSRKGSKLRLNLIESTPIRPTPLGMAALPVLSFAAAIFADITGAEELWVLDPDPGLESIYNNEGFGAREIYHGRRVGQRRIL